MPRKPVRVRGDALGHSEWLGAAPVPLTLDQVRHLLRQSMESNVDGATEIGAPFGDGGNWITYRFDSSGRTAGVRWDPDADPHDYRFACHYVDPGRTAAPPVYTEE